MAGDSAGGNLIAALTILCIQRGYKMPLALMMSYPAAYVGNQHFVPSILLSLDDILLPSKFLKGALNAYSGKDKEGYEHLLDQADTNELMSPLKAS